MSATRFSTRINYWSLQFQDPTLELRFQEQKEEDFARMWPRGIVLLMMATWILNIILRIVYNITNSNDVLYAAGVAALVTSSMGVVLEFLTHAISALRYLRGLFLCLGPTMAAVIYASYLYPTPVLMPGSIILFVLAIICNLYFAHDWRFSVLNQVIGHAAMTAFVAFRYVGSLNGIDIFIPLVSLNALLLFLPFFFYFAERDKQLIPFFVVVLLLQPLLVL